MRAVFVALLLAGCASGGPKVIEPTPENVASQFDAVAFNTDFRRSHGIVTKWTEDPVVAWLSSPQNAELVRWHRADLEATLRDIQAITGHLWREAAPEGSHSGSATLRIGFVPRRRFAEVSGSRVARDTRRIACMATYRMSYRSGEIRSAIALFGTDIPDRIRRDCILEELVQVMGLPADACHYRPSLFCEDDRVFEMTAADKLMLGILYDARLRPGMPRDEAMPIVRVLIGERWSSFIP